MNFLNYKQTKQYFVHRNKINESLYFKVKQKQIVFKKILV